MINWELIARKSFDANEKERLEIKTKEERLCEKAKALDEMMKRAAPFNARMIPLFDHNHGIKMYEVRVRMDPREVMYFAGGHIELIERWCDMVRAEIMHSIMREINRDPRP